MPRIHVAAGALVVAVAAALAVTLWPRRPMREPPPVIGAPSSPIAAPPRPNSPWFFAAAFCALMSADP